MTPYYADEAVTLWHGDCLANSDWLTRGSVLITDPPYGINFTGWSGSHPGGIANDHDFTAAAEALDWWAQWQKGPLAVFAGHGSLAPTIAAVTAVHARTRIATWHKSNAKGAPGNPWFADVEFIVCGVPEWPQIIASGVIAARRNTGNPSWTNRHDAYLHPTQKPVSLMEQVILSMPAGVIADPFAGSGSTLVAARNLGRKAVGVEIDESYCEAIAKRLDQGVLNFGGETA